MKQLLASFAAYDFWANEKLLSLVVSLTHEQQQQDINSSFPSLHKTCSHMWDAYRIWWERLQHDEQIAAPGFSVRYSTDEVVKHILILNRQWIEWIHAASETELASILAYKNLKGDSYQQPVQELLLHLFNHGTYHRGQLVTMLRQLGVDQIPQTDYIVYSRLLAANSSI